MCAAQKFQSSACGCMTEPDEFGVERVAQHSLTCPEHPEHVQTAWALIGTDYLVRIKGGRTTYEQVSFNDDGRASKVRLSRLTVGALGPHQIDRYVDPDTELEVVDG